MRRRRCCCPTFRGSAESKWGDAAVAGASTGNPTRIKRRRLTKQTQQGAQVTTYRTRRRRACCGDFIGGALKKHSQRRTGGGRINPAATLCYWRQATSGWAGKWPRISAERRDESAPKSQRRGRRSEIRPSG